MGQSIIITNIKWDTSDCDGEPPKLPKKVIVDLDKSQDFRKWMSNSVGEYLTANFGFCHEGFAWDWYKKPEKKPTGLNKKGSFVAVWKVGTKNPPVETRFLTRGDAIAFLMGNVQAQYCLAEKIPNQFWAVASEIHDTLGAGDTFYHGNVAWWVEEK